jgi:hypothetical protein
VLQRWVKRIVEMIDGKRRCGCDCECRYECLGRGRRSGR